MTEEGTREPWQEWLEFWRRTERALRRQRKAIFGKPHVISPVFQSQIDLIRSSGYFDAQWYQTRYPKAASAPDPIVHYVEYGAGKNMDPNRLFDSRMYRRAHDLSPEENPLVHFLNSGVQAAAGAYLSEEALEKIQQGFRARTASTLVRDSRREKRRFAVFMQCGGSANHQEWFVNKPRTWDFVANLFQEDSPVPEDADILLRQTGGSSKPVGFWSLLAGHPEIIEDYDYWMVMDDDLVTTSEDIDLLFALVEEKGLDLAQPALSRDSYFSWPVVLADPRGGMRKLNTVELMAPILSRRLLAAGKHLFFENISGWGIDFVLGKITRTQLGTDPAIIDAVAFRHCRAVDKNDGGYYRFLQKTKISSTVELRVLSSKYGTEITTIRELDQDYTP